MYLASTSAHSPIAVFDFLEDAEAFLCSIENTSLRFSCVQEMHDVPAILYRVYVESYPGTPERTLGYIRGGVTINPDYNVR